MLEELQTTSDQACLYACIDPKLPIEVFDMILHGIDRHNEFLSNLLDPVSSNQQPQHSLLLRRKGFNHHAPI